MSEKNAIEARDLRVVAGGKTLLSDLAFSVPQGSMTAVIGPNGAGKSTLLRTLAGITRPASGHVALFDDDIAGMARRDIARRLSYLPQDTWTDFDMSVRDAVALGRFAHHAAWSGLKSEDDDAIHAALTATELKGLESRTLPSLSGGERQRVFVARALAQQADVLIFDEPTSSLDPRHQLELLELLTKLNGDGRTILCAMHDLRLVWDVFPECALLSRGRLGESGPTHTVLRGQATADAFGITTSAEHGSIRWDLRRP